MQAGDLMFHSRAERLNELTPSPSVWNVIAIDPERYG